MSLLILTIMVSAIWWKVRRNHHLVMVEKHKYAFYALRDKVRMAAIDKKIDPDGFIFEYLDSSISKTIKKLSTINFFTVIAYGILHKGDDQVDKFRSKVMNELKGSPEGRRLYRAYGEMLVAYIVEKSFFTRFTFKHGFNTVARSIAGYSWIRRAIRNLRIIPETSVSGMYPC